MNLQKYSSDEWLLEFQAMTLSVSIEWYPVVKAMLKNRGIVDFWRDKPTRCESPSPAGNSHNAAFCELRFRCRSDEVPNWIAHDLDCKVERNSDTEWEFDLETSSPASLRQYVTLSDDDAVALELVRSGRIDSPRKSFGKWKNDEELDAALMEIDRQRHATIISG